MSWNQYSDDSWMQDDSEEQPQQNRNQTKTVENKQSKQSESANLNADKQQNKERTQDKKLNKDKQDAKQESTDNKDNKDNVDKQRVKKQVSKKQSRKYPTDSQLIQLYQNDKIQQKKRLKILYCNTKQQIQILQSLEKQKKIKKLRTIKTMKQDIFVVTFWNTEDLIKFIKEKIDKNYKFKVQEYIINEKQREFIKERQKQRIQNKAKQQGQRQKHLQRKHTDKDRDRDSKKVEYRAKNQQQNLNKQPKETKQTKKQFRKQKDEEGERKKQKQQKQRDNHDKKKQHSRGKQDKKHRDQKRQRNQKHQKHQRHQKYEKQQKRHKHYAKNLQKQKQRSNIVNVLSDQAEPEDAVQWLQQNKLFKQFNSIFLQAKGKYLQYIEKIAQITLKNQKYGLTTQIDEQIYQQKSQQTFKFVLQANKVPKEKLKPKSCIYIEKVSQQNFDNIQKFNIQVIGKKSSLEEEIAFDQKQYIQLFKKNYQTIVKKWPQWIVYAYNKNIAKLLRLSGIIKKQLLPKNKFKYEVGMEGKVPFAKFEICDLTKTAFKLDTTVINSHLQGL